MSDNSFFYVEAFVMEQNNLEAFLVPLEKENWRDICNSIVYLRCPKMREVVKKAGFEVDPRNDGVLALCFIDHEQGLSFYVIAAAHIRADNIFVSKENPASQVLLRASSMQNALCLKSDYINADVSRYESYVTQIVRQYEYGLDDAIKMRGITELDDFRKPFFPDDVEVLLLSKGLEQERVFVRLCKYGQGCLYGELLDEPDQDFGIHKGQIIDFMVLQREGGLSTVHLKK